MFLGPVGPVGSVGPGQGHGQGASTAKPLLSACAGAAGAAGADGGGATEEAVRPRSDAVAARETPEATVGLSQGLRQRVRGWVARAGSWVRGIAAAAIHLGRDGGRSQQGWLEIEMKKTPRPDQVKPLQLKVSC